MHSMCVESIYRTQLLRFPKCFFFSSGIPLLARGDLRFGIDAGVAGARRCLLRLVARGGTLEFSADFLDTSSAGA